MISAASASLAAVALLQAPSAAPVPAVAPPERVAQLGGGTVLLERNIHVIGDAQVKAQFDRLGLEAACPIYNRTLRAVVAKHGERFTPMLVAAMRNHVPDEVLGGRMTLPGLDAGLISYRTRVLRDLDQAAAPLYGSARGELRASFLAAAAQAAGGGGAGIFADWDLESPFARQVACSIFSAKPEAWAPRKASFDGLLKRKDQ